MVCSRRPWVFLCLLLSLAPAHAQQTLETKSTQAISVVKAVKIWDQAPHNAFTDLIRFQGRWFCTFRESKAHESFEGTLRILTSTDGSQWESAALITSKTSGLCDPKLTVTPDGQLMLTAAEWPHDRSQYELRSLVWFSRDGRTWSD
ncbi:MAG: sialidase family protein, partial [Gemmatales bacterium]|nr:sialidase family protein [Gemmatales bacterium]